MSIVNGHRFCYQKGDFPMGRWYGNCIWDDGLIALYLTQCTNRYNVYSKAVLFWGYLKYFVFFHFSGRRFTNIITPSLQFKKWSASFFSLVQKKPSKTSDHYSFSLYASTSLLYNTNTQITKHWRYIINHLE